MENNQEQLNNKEKYDQQRKEREQKRLNSDRWSQVKKVLMSVFILVIILLVGRWIYFSVKNSRSVNNPVDDIISKEGIHWHSQLSIEIKGVKQEIPKDIGIAINHQSIHTHEDNGTIHMEMSGLVRKNDTRLSEFFRIWGKKFDSNCIFDTCQSPEGKVKLLVNGKENNEFQNYLMRDGDKIEIKFE